MNGSLPLPIIPSNIPPGTPVHPVSSVILDQHIAQEPLLPPTGIAQPPQNVDANLDRISASAGGARGAWQSTIQGVKQFFSYTPYYAFKGAVLGGSALMFVGLSIPFGALSFAGEFFQLVLKGPEQPINILEPNRDVRFATYDSRLNNLGRFISAYCGEKINSISDSLLRFAGEQDASVRERKFQHTATGMKMTGESGKTLAGVTYKTLDVLYSVATLSVFRDLVTLTLSTGPLIVVGTVGCVCCLAIAIPVLLGRAILSPFRPRQPQDEPVVQAVPAQVVRYVENPPARFMHDKVYTGLSEIGKESFDSVDAEAVPFILAKVFHELMIQKATDGSMPMDAYADDMVLFEKSLDEIEKQFNETLTLEEFTSLRAVLCDPLVYQHWEGLFKEGYLEIQKGLNNESVKYLTELSKGTSEEGARIKNILETPKLVAVLQVLIQITGTSYSTNRSNSALFAAWAGANQLVGENPPQT